MPDLIYLEYADSLRSSSIRAQEQLVRKSIVKADLLLCFSEYVKSSHISKLPEASSKPISVVIHPNSEKRQGEEYSKIEMAERLRDHILGTTANRHFCDFPFEQIEYIFVSSRVRPLKNYMNVLAAYSQLLRRFRMNLKLIVTGVLSENEETRSFLNKQGLVFDVAEVPFVDDPLHRALIKHAACYLIPTKFEGGFPFGFSESINAGTPVAMSRIPVTVEILEDHIQSPEYFDPNDIDGIVSSVRYVLKNRNDVVKRQLQLLQTFPRRTWEQVADEIIEATSKIKVK